MRGDFRDLPLHLAPLMRAIGQYSHERPAPLSHHVPQQRLGQPSAAHGFAALSPDAFTARRIGFFPSLRATLNHILIIDHFYVDAMEGGTLGPAAWADREPYATVAALSEAQAAVDRRARHRRAPRRRRPQRIVSVHRATPVQRERLDQLLLHLFQHHIHHRGQAHAMLSATSVSRRNSTSFSAGEAPLRADEFAALGWTEETVWRKFEPS